VYDRAFLALPKYVGFFEAFLKHEPAAATDMVIYSLLGGGLPPCPADRMVYEANPAAISHQASVFGCFTSMPFFWKHHRFRSYVYSLYPEAAKLKDPDRARQFALCSTGGRLENIRLAHSYCQKIYR
jgi:hypothetical protein